MTRTAPWYRAVAACVAAAVVLAAVPAHAGQALVSLEETYQPFADRFNETSETVRFAAILSPT